MPARTPWLLAALLAWPSAAPPARADNGQPRACAPILAALAADLEALKGELPKLSAFSADQALQPGRCVLSYAHKTHEPTHRGGWTSGFPAPDRDGLAFHIHLYLRDEEAGQIDTQPVMPPWRLAGHRVTFLLLEGEEGPSAQARIYQLLRLHGLRIQGRADLDESVRRLADLAGQEGQVVLLGGTARRGPAGALLELQDGEVLLAGPDAWPRSLLGKPALALGRLRGMAAPQAQRAGPPALPRLEGARFRPAE
ncbi:MAG TPA: hypothetical protein PK668_26220 [Myxococcota bacterium]|nr:hypothetical protein [Myxococcota bacterium]HRY97023.1 hypothetical protein [Myxococcota bacterium]HSA23141.1 hypothetical protein [Myxococcota bacterium]